jgi:hypothetical protein
MATVKRTPIDQLALTKGELIHDRLTGRTGEYMGTVASRYYLRPVGGGLEWACYPSEAERRERPDE